MGTKLSWLGVRLVIRGSLVRFPATTGTLVVLGQNSLFHIASVYPAAKWVPSINKAVLRVCALYAASCSGISPGGLKWFLYVQCLLGEEGRVSTSDFGGYKTINRIPLPFINRSTSIENASHDTKTDSVTVHDAHHWTISSIVFESEGICHGLVVTMPGSQA